MCVCSGSVDGTGDQADQLIPTVSFFDSTKTFVSTLVLSWPDYGNALHAGPPVLLDKE